MAELLADPQISPALFSAIAALSVEINETRGGVSAQLLEESTYLCAVTPSMG